MPHFIQFSCVRPEKDKAYSSLLQAKALDSIPRYGHPPRRHRTTFLGGLGSSFPQT